MGGGGTSEYVLLTIGTRRAAPGRTTRRVIRRVVARRTIRRVATPCAARDVDAVELGAWTTPGDDSLGTWRTGNRGSGTTTSGTVTAAAGGAMIDLTVAVNRLA